ncbi:hypothetical protein F8154_01730 [Alkaliphilus pronyensis]|uniref:Uncharacterized protein n=1 Tax=Alkaliphilus pronyensis TaxID=1482732 RepID=A0A6I0FQT4_9FIRM|nr:hypothetical protein [Alkaliphilus pronyensis]KAB3538634.1 hypothetical protein F8154_01730 [Alkaliphilus pronyensis]
MKNKAIFILGIIITCFIITGCMGDTKEKYNSIGLPSFKEYQSLTESERAIIIDKTNHIPIEDVVNYFTIKIENYANSKELIDINSLSIHKDNLLMDQHQNKKLFNNIFISLELSINTNNMTREEAEGIASKMKEEIVDICINNDTYGFLKINTFNIRFIDHKNMAKFGYVTGSKLIEPLSTIEQTNEELETQTIAYNFANSYEDFSLKRFGIIDKEKELYIEIAIYDICDVDNQKEVLDSLNNLSDSLYNKIMSNIKSTQYIQSNNVDIVTTSFYLPWHEEDFVKYSYEVKNN